MQMISVPAQKGEPKMNTHDATDAAYKKCYNVMCKNCNNLRKDWCEKVLDSPHPDILRDCRHFWERTNADRIRAMTDRELAEFLSQKCADIQAQQLSNHTATQLSSLSHTWYCAWMQWLRQPPKGE